MRSFRTRMREASRRGARLVLACDYGPGEPRPERRIARDIATLHPHLCAIKLNFHALLPLGAAALSRVSAAAHRRGLQVIADIKLNDIGSTNAAAAGRLWEAGADALIANPIMGRAALASLVRGAHRAGGGVIALCHMSAPEARHSYELAAGPGRRRRLYEMFLEWAASAGADGLVVGATFPAVIRRCRAAAGAAAIYSPGVGAQGGSAAAALAAGADYLIAGRSITGSADPAAAARALALQAQG